MDTRVGASLSTGMVALLFTGSVAKSMGTVAKGTVASTVAKGTVSKSMGTVALLLSIAMGMVALGTDAMGTCVAMGTDAMGTCGSHDGSGAVMTLLNQLVLVSGGNSPGPVTKKNWYELL